MYNVYLKSEYCPKLCPHPAYAQAESQATVKPIKFLHENDGLQIQRSAAVKSKAGIWAMSSTPIHRHPRCERWHWRMDGIRILGTASNTRQWGIDPATMEVTASKRGESLLLLWGHQVVYQHQAIYHPVGSWIVWIVHNWIVHSCPFTCLGYWDVN